MAAPAYRRKVGMAEKGANKTLKCGNTGTDKGKFSEAPVKFLIGNLEIVRKILGYGTTISM